MAKNATLLNSSALNAKAIAECINKQFGEKNAFLIVSQNAVKAEKARIARANDRAYFNEVRDTVYINQDDFNKMSPTDQYLTTYAVSGELKRMDRNAQKAAARDRAIRKRAEKKAARKAAGIEPSQSELDIQAWSIDFHERKLTNYNSILNAGLRSDAHTQLKQFIEGTSRNTLAGPSVDRLKEHNKSDKIFALNEVEIRMNDKVISVIIVRLKGTYNNVEAVLDAVTVHGVDVPSIVSSRGSDGRLVDPNLIYQFPAVSCCGNARDASQRALHAARRGLLYMLKPIGSVVRADPLVVCNPLSTKVEHCYVTGPVYTLSELLLNLPRHVSDAQLYGSDVQAEDFIGKVQAGIYTIWTASHKGACEIIKEFWTEAKEHFGAFLAKFAEFVRKLGKLLGHTTDYVENMITAIATDVWAKHNPAFVRKWKQSGVGVCRELVKGKTLTERLAVGGYWTSSMRRNESLNAVLEARKLVLDAGIAKPTPAQIQAKMTEETKLSERQIRRYLVLISKAEKEIMSAKEAAIDTEVEVEVETVSAETEKQAVVIPIDRYAKFIKMNEDIRAGRATRIVIDRYPSDRFQQAA